MKSHNHLDETTGMVTYSLYSGEITFTFKTADFGVPSNCSPENNFQTSSVTNYAPMLHRSHSSTVNPAHISANASLNSTPVSVYDDFQRGLLSNIIPKLSPEFIASAKIHANSVQPHQSENSSHVKRTATPIQTKHKARFVETGFSNYGRSAGNGITGLITPFASTLGLLLDATALIEAALPDKPIHTMNTAMGAIKKIGLFARDDISSNIQEYQTYNGSIEDYTRDQMKLESYTRVRVWGHNIQSQQLLDFLRAVANNKVKELDLAACDLNQEAGSVIGYVLGRENNNNTIERLEVSSSRLEKIGMLSLLADLRGSKTLKKLVCHSYNVWVYYWSYAEVIALRDLLLNCPTLKEVLVPDNQLKDPEQVTILTDVYRTTAGSKLATIRGFELGRSSIPDFNVDNANNGSLDSTSRIEFINRF